MTNFFEEELRRLFGDGGTIGAPSFAGRACLGTLNRDLLVKAGFVTTGKAQTYDALRVRVINRDDGEIDRLTLLFRDVWGKKPVPGNPNFPNGVEPRIWIYQEKASWYAWRPGAADRKVLLEQVGRYLDVYRDRTPERAVPRTVYLCVPTGGGGKADAEFARQKSLEELHTGNVPLCPLLLLPPDAYPENNRERADALREISAHMLDACHEIRVCAKEPTPEMTVEIQRAASLGIPVRSDAETESRKRTAAQSGRKRSPAR